MLASYRRLSSMAVTKEAPSEETAGRPVIDVSIDRNKEEPSDSFRLVGWSNQLIN